VKNPAGDFLQKETNSDVARQVSQARVRRAKEDESNERKRKEAAGEEVPEVCCLGFDPRHFSSS
jgi:actin-related protein 8